MKINVEFAREFASVLYSGKVSAVSTVTSGGVV